MSDLRKNNHCVTLLIKQKGREPGLHQSPPYPQKRSELYAFASVFNFSRCSFKIALRLNLILLPSSASTFTRI